VFNYQTERAAYEDSLREIKTLLKYLIRKTIEPKIKKRVIRIKKLSTCHIFTKQMSHNDPYALCVQMCVFRARARAFVCSCMFKNKFVNTKNIFGRRIDLLQTHKDDEEKKNTDKDRNRREKCVCLE
jgi:predicted secreted protein